MAEKVKLIVDDNCKVWTVVSPGARQRPISAQRSVWKPGSAKSQINGSWQLGPKSLYRQHLEGPGDCRVRPKQDTSSTRSGQSHHAGAAAATLQAQLPSHAQMTCQDDITIRQDTHKTAQELTSGLTPSSPQNLDLSSSSYTSEA